MTRGNQLIVSMALLLIIVLGLGGYFLYGRNAAKNPVATNSAAPTPANNAMSATIKDLFTSGETKQCTFTAKGEKGDTKGTIYVAKDNAAGKITSTDSGKDTTTNFIRNSGTFYIWGGDLPTGIKMNVSVSDLADKLAQSKTQSFDPNKKADFKCSAWTADNAMFTTPKNIKFLDVTSMMPHTTGMVTPGVKHTGDPCASIADAATRTACEKAVKQQGY